MDERLRQERESEAARAGFAKMMEEDYRAALALLIPLAEEGNAFALFNIGFMSPFLLELSDPDIDRVALTEDAELDWQFRDREEPLSDATRAQIKWYTKASAQGNPEAILQLSQIYNHGNLGNPPWHSLTGQVREMYELAAWGGYFARGPALMDEIRAEMRAAGMNPQTVFDQQEVPSYISGIPEHAREEDVTKRHGAGRGKVVKNYYLGRSYVGQRVYNKDGLLEHECSYKNGKKHGWEYHWGNGRLSWAVPYDSGREHGIAREWGSSGVLLGSYTMDHGTGIDFWWDECEGKPQLTEARVVVDSLMNGYEYWFEWGNPDVLRKEKWWSKGDLHGIEREWNDRGKLRRGFPKYWIHGRQVDKRAYVRAVKADPILRPFCIDDNQPYRVFPPEVAAHLPRLLQSTGSGTFR